MLFLYFLYPPSELLNKIACAGASVDRQDIGIDLYAIEITTAEELEKCLVKH